MKAFTPKRIFAVILAVLMLASMLPVSVFATGSYSVTVTNLDEEKIAEIGADYAFSFSPEEGSDFSAILDKKADFYVSFNKPVEACSYTLVGQYGSYDWISIPGKAYDGTNEIALLASYGFDSFTVNDVVNLVGTFNCGVKSISADADMTVALRVEGIEEPLVSKTVTLTPAFSVTDITEGNELGADYLYTFSTDLDADKNAVSCLSNYEADYIISFDKAVAAGSYTLMGQYDTWSKDWVVVPGIALEAGEEFALLKDGSAYFMGGESFGGITFAEVCSLVKTFNCGVTSLCADATMTVKLVLKNGDETYVLNTTEAVLSSACVVEEISLEGADVAYSYSGNVDTSKKAVEPYLGYKADLVISFSKDVEAEDYKFVGAYDSYKGGEPVTVDGVALEANEELKVLEALNITCLFDDMFENIGTFKCGVKNKSACADMTIKLILTKDDSTIVVDEMTVPLGLRVVVDEDTTADVNVNEAGAEFYSTVSLEKVERDCIDAETSVTGVEIKDEAVQEIFDAAKEEGLEAKEASVINIEVSVKVTLTKFDEEGTVSFSLTPVATVWADDDKENAVDGIEITNKQLKDYAEDEGIAVTLYAPNKPTLITHTSDEGEVIESWSGAAIVYDDAHSIVTLTIKHFSSIELYMVDPFDGASTYDFNVSVTLKEGLALNLYVNADAANNYIIKSSYYDDYKKETVALVVKDYSELTLVEGYYKIVLGEFYAYQMTKDISIEIYYNSFAVPFQSINYSIKKYCEALDKTTDESLKALSEAILIYGAESQKYFDGKSFTKDGQTVDYVVSDVAALEGYTIPDVSEVDVGEANMNGKTAGLEFSGVSLVLSDTIAIKFYMEPNGDYKAIEGSIIENDGNVSMKFDVKLYELLTAKEYKFGDTTFTISAAYVANMLKSELGNAIVNLAKCADNYFNNIPVEE